MQCEMGYPRLYIHSYTHTQNVDARLHFSATQVATHYTQNQVVYITMTTIASRSVTRAEHFRHTSILTQLFYFFYFNYNFFFFLVTNYGPRVWKETHYCYCDVRRERGADSPPCGGSAAWCRRDWRRRRVRRASRSGRRRRRTAAAAASATPAWTRDAPPRDANTKSGLWYKKHEMKFENIWGEDCTLFQEHYCTQK